MTIEGKSVWLGGSRSTADATVCSDATERVPPVGAVLGGSRSVATAADGAARVPPVGANPVATAADGAARALPEFRI